MGREKQKTEVRREQIATAALQLVAGQGMKALTLDRLASMVGLVPSAIYRHFGGKDDILRAILELMEARFAGNLQKAKDDSQTPLETVRRLLQLQVGLIMEFHAVPRILFSEEVFSGNPERRQQLNRMIQGFLARLGKVFEEGQALGQIRPDVPASALAVMFLGLFQPPLFLWHLSGGEFDVVRQADQAWRVFSAGLLLEQAPTAGAAG